MAIASNLVRQNVRISRQAVTSPIFRIKGQRSRWFYPDERLTPEHCEKMRNIDISERGVAHSRYGYEPYTEKTLAESGTSNYSDYSITGLKSVTYADGNNRRIVIGSTSANPGAGTTKMWEDQGNGATITELTGSTNLSAGNDVRFQFEFLKDKTWCKGVFAHQNLLLVYGTTEGGTYFPTRLRYCDADRNSGVLDTNKWTALHRTEVYDGGTAIIGAVDAWGQALVFKEDGLYPGAIVYDNLGHFSYQQGKPIKGFSPTGRDSIAGRPEFVCGLAKEGIFVVTPDMQYQIVNSDDITTFFDLNSYRLDKAQVMIREADHQVRWYVSSTGTVLDPKVAASNVPLRSSGAAGFDMILVWDWETGDTWLDTPSHLLNCISSFVGTDGKQKDWIGAMNNIEKGPSGNINGGNAFGRIYTGNQPSVNEDNGIPYSWEIKMSPNDLGLPGRSKHILNVRTLYRKRSGQQKLTFNASINEGRESAYTEEVQLGTGIAWGQGTSYNQGKKWPGTGALRADVFVNRVCETIAPEWSSSSPASIEGYIVEYIPLDS